MAKVCQITGKKRTSGNNVSHSQRKTKRSFMPNLQSIAFNSEKLNRKFKLRTTTAGIRTIEHNGGLDKYLLDTPNSKLSKEAMKIKKLLLEKVSN